MSRNPSQSDLRWTHWTVVVSLVLAALVSTAIAAPPRPNGPALARAIQVQKRHSESLLATRDVVGTATGIGRDGKHVVKVYAARAGVAGIPKELEGVPVVVEAIGKFYALQQLDRVEAARRGPDRTERDRRDHERRDRDRRDRDRRDHERRGPERSRDRRPYVMIVSPDERATVSGVCEVEVYVRDDKGVRSVRFAVDGQTLGTDADSADGWSYSWDTVEVDNGWHLLSATAIDTAGQTSTDHVRVEVDNAASLLSPDGRPAPIGVSTGNEHDLSAGTIACRVRDAAGSVYALSNNHVYARMNRARLGEQILQPGLLDSGNRVMYADQVIGMLADFVPLNFSAQASNAVDAAIAVSTLDDLGNATPLDGYGRPKSQPVAAYVGQALQKYGRSTQLTHGTVSGLEATVVVDYGGRSVRFTGQIVVNGAAGFIDAGDSGALMVTYDAAQSRQGGRAPVGLLFAGSEDGSMAIANPIQTVLDALEVTIDGE